MRTWDIKTGSYYSAARYWIRGLKLSIKFPSLNIFISTMEKIIVTLIVRSVQLLSHVWLFVTPWTASLQASLSITNSQSLLKLMSIVSVMPSNHLILYRPLLLLPPIFPCIWVFSNEAVLCMRWPKYWSFTFSISPSSGYSGLISFRIDGLDLLAVQGLSRVFSNTTVRKHQFFSAQLSL